MNALYVFLGGGAGSVPRYLVGRRVMFCVIHKI